jgi:hypothetical protein
VFDALERIRADLAVVVKEERAGWAASAQSARVQELAALRERVDAELVRAVSQWDAERCWEVDGLFSPSSWLRHFTALDRAEAHRVVRSARLVREHDATAAALAAGTITSTHVAALGSATRNREDFYADGEQVLLDAATTLSLDGFTRVVQHWRSLADDALAHHDAYAIHERRHLHASKTMFGTVRIDGELDLDGGATVLAALAELDGADVGDRALDDRTQSQRNADNLVQLATTYLAGEPAGRRSVARASLLCDVERLRPPAAGPLALSALTGPRELVGLGPVARETALRLTCDAQVSRVVTRGRSQVLDLGRATRVVSPAQRRALTVRDRGCVFPGCDRPPDWCDGHHLHHWAEGGPTDLDNLVLLCRRHHVLCHEGGWHLARDPDGRVTATRPDAAPLRQRSSAA